jgi:hypothetical protein
MTEEQSKPVGRQMRLAHQQFGSLGALENTISRALLPNL